LVYCLGSVSQRKPAGAGGEKRTDSRRLN
jgi:hypothetical protein